MTQWQVNSSTATQIVYAGDPETLIVNKNTKYTILIGNNSATGSGTQSDATPLGPYESLVVNGQADVYAIAQVVGTACLVITQTNALLWTPKAIQPNIVDPNTGFNPGIGAVGINLNVPPGAQGLMIGWNPVGGSTAYFTMLEVSGVQSGLIYTNINPGLSTDRQSWVPILSDADSVVTVSTIMVGHGGALTLVWIMAPFMSGFVDSGQANNVNIVGVGISGATLPVTFNGASQPVFLAGLSNLGLVSNQPPIQINASLAAGASAVILPAVAGTQYFLHGIRIEAVAASAFDCDIKDTSGALIGSLFQEIIGAPAASFRPPMGDTNLHGAPLATGLGVQITNSGGAAQQFVGILTYSK